MKIYKSNQNGFHVVEIIIVLAIVTAVGLVGWKVIGSKNKADGSKSNSTQTKTISDKKELVSFVEWSFNGEKWLAMGDAPECSEPLSVKAPIDLTKANSKLLPGQVRGGDYKPHGGLGLDYSKYQNKVDVMAMGDGYLYRGSRYIEAGEVQYMFDFMNSCGILYRYDHLLTLSPDFDKYAQLLPTPKIDDSRTEKFKDPVLIKAGTLIATEVGFRNMKNPGFDVGVYDLRSPNAASQTSLFKTDQKRIQDKEQSYFSLCWFDLLPGKDRSIVSSLPTRSSSETDSDFCK